LLGALSPSLALAQTDHQVWGALTVDRINSHSVSLSVDVEPRRL
jgi:hypothetical protein